MEKTHTWRSWESSLPTSIDNRPSTDEPAFLMNAATKFFLVVLRLAIGWHFLFEGAEKLNTVYTGPTADSKPFTSTPFLRQSTGPLRPFIMAEVGDPGEQALAHLEPDAIKAEWQDYFEHFVQHYGVVDDQGKRAQTVLADHEKNLLDGKHMFRNIYPGRTVAIEETLAERTADYRRTLEDIQQREQQELRVFNRDVEQAKLQQAKSEAGRRRGELLALVSDKTEDLKKALTGLLTPAQKAMEPLTAPAVARAHWLDWDNRTWLIWLAAWATLVVGAVIFLSNLGSNMRNWGHRDELGAFGRGVSGIWTVIGAGLLISAAMYIYVEWRSYSWIEVVDWLSSWGLLMIGAGLLVGLMTRSACLAGALFLLMLYVAMPPWPWLPDNPRTEGHYLIVNKNSIEMFALLALATTRSGRWLGLDALLQFFNPWRYRRRRIAVAPQHPRLQRVIRV